MEARDGVDLRLKCTFESSLRGAVWFLIGFSQAGGRPRFLTRPVASFSRHSMAAASASRSPFKSWMIRLRSTLRRLQEPSNVFVPPRRTLAGSDFQPIQLIGDPSQRLAALPEPLNAL